MLILQFVDSERVLHLLYVWTDCGVAIHNCVPANCDGEHQQVQIPIILHMNKPVTTCSTCNCMPPFQQYNHCKASAVLSTVGLLSGGSRTLLLGAKVSRWGV